MQSAQTHQKIEDTYNMDRRIKLTFSLIQNELSKANQNLIVQYDKEMKIQALGKTTRHKHLQIILSLSRMLNKDWKKANRSDIRRLILMIWEKYTDDLGRETYSSYDHKKVLRIFFRWIKFGLRSYEEVGDPPELEGIRLRKVHDNISRVNLISDEDRRKLLAN